MNDRARNSAAKWWAVAVLGLTATLLIVWLGRIAGVSMRTLLSIGAGALALAWLIALVAVPWNLYFAARRVVTEMAVSAQRGIVIPAARVAEARQIAGRMLWFALGGHVATATAAAVLSYFAGTTVGYYFTGSYLVSALIRPAAAYFGYLRERIRALSRESKHPRDDVVSLRDKVDELAGRLAALRAELQPAQRGLSDALLRAESKLTDDIAHTRQLLTADLARIQDAQATDREAARSRDEDLGRRIDQMVRTIDQTLDGISDHQELLTGLRALVRMIKSDTSAPP
ncbi:MAG TPA: hypothetical protein VNF47_16470 [Streptosporangiaceae bacterium]|nr:hypothetical protein [Streptosporangiaceae bacterium]